MRFQTEIVHFVDLISLLVHKTLSELCKALVSFIKSHSESA